MQGHKLMFSRIQMNKERWYGRCSCGWKSGTFISKRDVLAMHKVHVARMQNIAGAVMGKYIPPNITDKLT